MPLFHVLSKLLPAPFYPLGFALCTGAAGLVLMRVHKRLGVIVIVVGLMALYLSSTRVMATTLVRSLEARYDPPETHPRASAIVLLGGGCVAPSAPRRYPETNIWGDRVTHAARLYKAGRAPYVIATGGNFPFLYDSPFTEAENAASLLAGVFGIDSTALVLADSSRNTREDAIEVVRVIRELGSPYEILLVTSAMHMPRAVRLMRKQGIEVHPAPADYHANRFRQWKLMDFLPRADALMESTLALHEYFGLVAYRLLGWI